MKITTSISGYDDASIAVEITDELLTLIVEEDGNRIEFALTDDEIAAVTFALEFLQAKRDRDADE